jgi:hypothetical protein
LQQGLVPHHTQAFDFLMQAIGIVHAPRPRDDLRCNITFVGNSDTVGKGVQIAGRIRLLRQKLGDNFHLEFVVWHVVILPELQIQA